MIKALIFDCFGVFYTDPVFAYMRDPQTPPKKAEVLHGLDVQAAYGRLSKADFVHEAALLLNCQAKEAEDWLFVGRDRN